MKPEFLSEIALSMNMVGSRYTCNPPPTETDEDWLVLIEEKSWKDGKAFQLLDENHFKLDKPQEHYRADESNFNSWRGFGVMNILITSRLDWHDRFLAATALAKKYNLMSRDDRVELFQTVLYSTIPQPEQFTYPEKRGFFYGL